MSIPAGFAFDQRSYASNELHAAVAYLHPALPLLPGRLRHEVFRQSLKPRRRRWPQRFASDRVNYFKRSGEVEVLFLQLFGADRNSFRRILVAGDRRSSGLTAYVMTHRHRAICVIYIIEPIPMPMSMIMLASALIMNKSYRATPTTRLWSSTELRRWNALPRYESIGELLR